VRGRLQVRRATGEAVPEVTLLLSATAAGVTAQAGPPPLVKAGSGVEKPTTKADEKPNHQG